MYQRVEFAFAVAILAAIVGLIGIAAVARFFGAPIIWSIEIAQLLFAWEVMLAADLALQKDRHFGLSILLDNVSPRGKLYVETFNILILIVLLGFLLSYAITNTMLVHLSRVGALQFPASLIHASMPFGIALMLRTLLVKLWYAIADIRGAR